MSQIISKNVCLKLSVSEKVPIPVHAYSALE